MIYYKTLQIIGNSIWAKKLHSILARNTRFHISNIGARNFLSESTRNSNHQISQPDFFWIATNPDLQIQVMKKLRSKTSTIILEKPYALNSNQWHDFVKTVSDYPTSIRFSQPWFYSSLWENARKLLSDISGNLNITITREGFVNNNYIPKHLNWLSHDVFLLNDLFYDSNLDAMKSRSNFINDTFTLFLELTGQFKVTLQNSITNQRRSVWEISSDSIKLNLDFNSQNLTSNVSGFEKMSFVNDQPLMNMLLQFETADGHFDLLKDLRMQELLLLN